MQHVAGKTKGGLLVPAAGIMVCGAYHGQIIRDGEVVDDFMDSNLVVNQGLNSLLNIMFNNATQVGTWYLGLFEGNYTPVASVTASSIAVDASETTAYDEASRPEFNEAAASSQSITNSANRGTFTFNATKTIYGAFLVSSSTKAGTSGTLFSAARFGSAKNVVAGDQLLLAYTFNATST